MTWYAAHAILYMRLKAAPQEDYTVWENVYLIEADDPVIAHAKAKERAVLDAGDSDGSLRVDGQPAEWVFAGIRKLIDVFHLGEHDIPASGDELTFSQFIVPDLATIQRLARGEDASVLYSDPCREDEVP